ncbi:MAG: hypothetical protein ACR2I2_15770 [Bryobacteraceae bacterium]
MRDNPMHRYRIHRMKDATRQTFRWTPHVTGTAGVKPKDYEEEGAVEAENEYAAWAALRASDRPLALGDLLETESGELKICKYVGFEAANWVLPEPVIAP